MSSGEAAFAVPKDAYTGSYQIVVHDTLAPNAKEPQELIETWKYLYSVEASPTKAWAGVLSAVLRDPSVIFY